MLSADGKALLRHVRLTVPEIKFVDMIAERGGELAWDWGKLTPPAADMVRGLIVKGVLVESIRASAPSRLRLTDGGRQVVDQIRKMSVAPAM